ncbi:carboxypeptidase-like regulatory domain-containing protein [Tenacibaculum sp. 190524A05c]|uniref:carboxypeptidase-like regulatory domain-containing protein n=1 Tax=Tenacibaculum platacis TaxID=3137852 RepID=UPI0032B20DD9
MKSKFTLEINKPCSEKFSGFKKTELGGFCDSCQKEVIDFTGWSSQEIINYFNNNSNQKTCGRFNDYQLGSYVEPTKPNRLNYFKGIGVACLALFSFGISNAQKENTPTEIVAQKLKNQKNTKPQNTFVVKGVVSDEAGPLPGVSIQLENSIVGTESDFDGKFVFPQKLKKGDVLIFSFVGMDTQKIKIENDTSVSNIELKVNIEMAGCVFLGEVTVKKPFKSKKKFWKKN